MEEIQLTTPNRIRKTGRPRLYPFDELMPGQFFRIPGKRVRDIKGAVRLACERTGYDLRAWNTFGGAAVMRHS